jgi:hypothetical protein
VSSDRKLLESTTLSAIKAKQCKPLGSFRLQRKIGRNSTLFEPIKAKTNKPSLFNELSSKQGIYLRFSLFIRRNGTVTQLEALRRHPNDGVKPPLQLKLSHYYAEFKNLYPLDADFQVWHYDFGD